MFTFKGKPRLPTSATEHAELIPAKWCIYQIDDLILNTQLGTLYRDDQEILLPQLSYTLLCQLVQRAPAIVSQHDLMTLVWGAQVVSDETLKQRIKLLRQAMSDTPQDPRYIGSVRGRGYRCIATVTEQIIEQPIAPTNTRYTHDDSINLRHNDRLPVSFMQSSADYWRLVAVFFLIIFTVFATVVTLNITALSKATAVQQPTAVDNLTATDGISAQAKAAFDKGRTFYLRYQSLDNEMAIKSFQRATQLAPGYALAFAGLADAYSQGVFQFSGDPSWQKKALAAAYDAIMLNDQLAQSYKSLGTAHYVNGHLSQALSANLKAADLDSDHLEAHANLGYIYSERGQLKNALEHHKSVYQLDPAYPVNWYHIALTLQRLGDDIQALKWYKKVINVRPYYHLPIFHYTHLLIRLGKTEMAIKQLKIAEKHSPDSLNVLKALIDVYLLSHQPTQSQPWIHKLKLLSNAQTHQYAQLLSLLTQQPLPREALQSWYDKHADDYDERPFSNIQLAIAATKLGATDTAFRHLTQAIELGWLDSYYIHHFTFLAPLQSDAKFSRVVKLLERKRQYQLTLLKGELPLNW
ncbi:MAG: DNA-binding winged helix-turn-helix (wHTH) protein/tetratricopeptide (TPR) repeat protein [Alteromonadaceae bacterium]|jgi:DNA-binding winged helix-turn-helix (wHTH) protein/tetratricopeptide (TPR) repeat protein